LNKKAGLPAVFLVVLIDLMGFGIVLPLLPYYASRFEASPLTIGLLFSVYSFSQLIFSPIWGAWSDRVGRRPIMLLSTLGSTASYFIFSFSHSLALLFFSRIIAGVMGGNIAAAQAYVADVTEPEDRAKGMGVIGAAFGIGFALGPALASFFLMPAVRQAILNIVPEFASHYLTENPFSIPGIAASILSLSSFLLILMRLPESASLMKADDAFRIKKNSVFTGIFWSSIFSKSSAVLGLLYGCMLLVTIGHSSLYSSFPLFCKQILNLGPEKVGIQFLIMGMIAIVVQGGLIRPLVRVFGERKLLIIGNILMTLGLFLIPLANSETTLSIYLSVLALGGSLNGPTLTSLISKEAERAHVGLAMGNSQGIAALGRVIGPAWGGWLFGILPRAPFFVTALLVSATIWMSFSSKLSKIP
jgi:DHA1 family tetracycline resistance protein-like MFS transporter